jgi:hypothetical protein
VSATRLEERYLFKSARLQEFQERLGSISDRVIHPTDINETVYFDNADHELPFEHSMKARHYTALRAASLFTLNPQDMWIMELKSEIESSEQLLRKKERAEMPLADLLGRFSSLDAIDATRLSQPLVPFLADSYYRTHYLVSGNNGFRVTVDTQPIYYLFTEPLVATQCGKEDYVRVELKISDPNVGQASISAVLDALNAVGAAPAVSKKDMAYNMISAYLRAKHYSPIPESDTEIEAKLSLNGNQQHVFNQIKHGFAAGAFPGFRLIETFPFTQVGGKLNSYAILPNNDYQRISIKGEQKVLTVKDEAEVVDDALGLGCILRRREIKSPVDPAQEGKAPTVTLYRKRKYFLVRSERSGREYCILIDRCVHGGSKLFQIEVEETLLRPTKEQENQAAAEIAEITGRILDMHPGLKPTSLTKREWLMGVAATA